MPTEMRFEVNEDGDIVVHVPMRLRRESKRTVVAEADGDKFGIPDTPLVQAVARAVAWRERLERGEFGSAKDMAEALGIDPSNLRHTLNIAYLSPRILEAIAEGRELPPDISVARLMRVTSLVWSEQERELGFSSRV